MPVLLSADGVPTFAGSGHIEDAFTLTLPALLVPPNGAVLITFIARPGSANDPISVVGPASVAPASGMPGIATTAVAEPWSYEEFTRQIIAVAFPDGFEGDYVLDGWFEQWSGCGPFDVEMDARYCVVHDVDPASLQPENFAYGHTEVTSGAASDLVYGVAVSIGRLVTDPDLDPYFLVVPDDNLVLQDVFSIVQGPVVIEGQDHYASIAVKPATVSFTAAGEVVWMESALSVRMWGLSGYQCEAASDPNEWEDQDQNSPPIAWQAVASDGRWWFNSNVSPPWQQQWLHYIGEAPIPAEFEITVEIVVTPPPPWDEGTYVVWRVDSDDPSEQTEFMYMLDASSGVHVVPVTLPGSRKNFRFTVIGSDGYMYGGVVAVCGPAPFPTTPAEHFRFRGFADSYFPELTVAPRVDLREGVGTGCPPYTPRAPGGSMIRSVPSRTKP